MLHCIPHLAVPGGMYAVPGKAWHVPGLHGVWGVRVSRKRAWSASALCVRGVSRPGPLQMAAWPW